MALLTRNILKQNKLVAFINYNQHQTYAKSIKYIIRINKTSLLIHNNNKTTIRLSSSGLLGQQNKKSNNLTKKLFLSCLAAIGISGLCLHFYSEYVLVDFNEKNQFNVSKKILHN